MCHVGRRQDQLCGTRSVALAGKCHVGDLEIVKIRGCLYYSIHVRTQDRWINTRCVTSFWLLLGCGTVPSVLARLSSSFWLGNQPSLGLIPPSDPWLFLDCIRPSAQTRRLSEPTNPPLGTQPIPQPTPQIGALRGIAEKPFLGVDELGAKWTEHRRLARVLGLKNRMVHDEACSLVGVSSPVDSWPELNKASCSGRMGLV